MPLPNLVSAGAQVLAGPALSVDGLHVVHEMREGLKNEPCRPSASSVKNGRGAETRGCGSPVASGKAEEVGFSSSSDRSRLKSTVKVVHPAIGVGRECACALAPRLRLMSLRFFPRRPEVARVEKLDFALCGAFPCDWDVLLGADAVL